MIIEITKNDLTYIEKLKKAFPNEFKSECNIIEEFINNVFCRYLIYIENDKIIAFINYYDMYDRFEVANIVVIEEYRNKKVGSKLIERIIEIGCKKNIENITLEVRYNNEPAIKLYEKYDFKKVAIRKKYYNGIDGILMERKMM